ncbi:transmembrane channel-like protein 5 [Mizuhopecten yessoensis]|uniref:Transmembrane channel-like protein 5 n=1 Tax=Mizuhopecten yessoensis TaxID=6573 RepID=A0A210QNW6_MIZYE|nr:transmembrane channel-like protein 5 [Mizuhopecten yessoensis]XP_021353576.1 transmembrane channel-like protein 5 [Mizuhopecten yessoensis]OWF50434.1 Transmembrane channel-like protein 5 [Mizuhopecten yessoensis]
MDYRGNPNGYPDPRGPPEQVQMHSVNPGYTEPTHADNGRPPYVIDMHSGIQDLEDRNGGEEDVRYLHARGSRRNWAADNQRDATDLINELPSRQLEQIASDVAKGTIRRKKSKKSFHGTVRGHHDYNDLAASLSRDPDLMDEFDGETRTTEVLRDMAVKLTDKKEIRNNISNSRQRTLKRGIQSRRPGWWKRTKYSIGIGWMHFKYRLAELAYSLELWRSLTKKIEGHFGTGVTSYFMFLKWIFLLNIPIFFLTLCFIVIPQIVYVEFQPSAEAVAAVVAANNMTNVTTTAPVVTTTAAFTGRELLTGSGYFTNTILYYGYYTNGIVQVVGDTEYNMKYAYLLTGGGYYILCLIILALSISRSYKKNYIEASGVFNFYIVTKVFCSWDYNITSPDAARLQHKSFFNEIKEFLSGKKLDGANRDFSTKCKWFFLRVITNLIVLGSIGGSAYCIYYIQDTDYIKNSIVILGKLAMPLVATGIILVLPFFFTRIGKLENYQKPQTELYVGMTRTMLLKAAILGVLAYFWFNRATKEDEPCWETSLGEDIYRLVLVDFVFTLISTFFLEFIRRLLGQYCCKRLGDTEFDIGRNTLDLIYSQALCWLGTFYSPLLSFIMSIKLFIIFYIKAVSVLQNCKPSVRAWRAAKSHTIFLGYLFIFFLLAVVAVSYGVLLVPPSETCGPFQGQEQAYDIVTTLVDSWEGDLDWLHQIFKLVSSPGFIASVLVAFSVGTYYMRIVMVGHKEMVKLLRQQLAMEGRDKAYLLNMLQEVSRSKKEKLRPSTENRILSPTSATSMESLTSPGGRRFARTMAETAAANTPQQSPVPSRRNRRMDSNENLTSRF